MRFGLRLFGLVLAGTVALGAAAQDNGPLTLKVATSLGYDSNLFRLTDTIKQTVKAQGSEQTSVTTLSLNFSTTLSLQKIDLTIGVVDARYQNFDYLNATAYNYNAALHWSLTPHLHGTLSSERKETQNSFADSLSRTQSNLRTDTNNRLDAVYEVDGPWRLLAGVSNFSQANEQALVAGGDYQTSKTELGFAYVLASGSSATLRKKSGSGQYLNQLLPSAGLYDNRFDQAETELRLHWVMLPDTAADMFVTQTRQSHPNYPQRDFSGLDWGASLNWTLTGKSALLLSGTRSHSAYATATDNYTQTDRLSIGPVWQISPKTVLRLRHEWASINYLGSTSLAAPSQRRDITQDTLLGIDWQAYQQLWFSAALQKASRTSNQNGLDYDSSQATLSAQYSY